MIIGSFPIGKFTDPKRRGEIKDSEIDFFFGGERNLLWKILSEVFGRSLKTKKEIQDFLIQEKLGIGDVIKSCVRREGSASDSDLKEIEWNHALIDQIIQKEIKKVYFTSRQVEKWFKQLSPPLKGIGFVTLLSPSGQTARSIVRRDDYQEWLKMNPQKATFEYLVQRYKESFNND